MDTTVEFAKSEDGTEVTIKETVSESPIGFVRGITVNGEPLESVEIDFDPGGICVEQAVQLSDGCIDRIRKALNVFEYDVVKK